MRVTSQLQIKYANWQTTLVLILGVWLGAVLLLDWVIMPSLYISGMMTMDGFASTGYLLFWIFNRLELIVGGLVLSGFILLLNEFRVSTWQVFAGVLLLVLSLFETYFLTPQMSAIAINLSSLVDSFSPPSAMNVLHGCYWALETGKLVILGVLLNSLWHNQQPKN